MAIYLGHTTAQRILESRLVRDIDTGSLRGPINCITSKEEVTQILASAFTSPNGLPLDNPLYLQADESIDVVVEHTTERSHWKGITCHVLPSGIPPRSFLLLNDDVMVACPELCFLQQCSHLSLIGAIMLAMSFCGVYGLTGESPIESAALSDDSMTDSIFNRRPIMTVESAREYLDGITGVRGINRAKRALDFVLPMSGSPMETRLALPFYLPTRLGGFGLPRPILNPEIPLNEAAAAIAGQKVCRGDLVWEYLKLLLVMEYQSREYHDIREKYGADYGRQLALQSMGHDVRFVTSAQLASIEQITELARVVAAHMHVKLTDHALKLTSARKRLFDELNTYE